MPLLIITYLAQIGCAVHAMKRGYPFSIIFLIVAFPVVGCIVYVVAVLLPELKNSRQAQTAAAGIRDTIDPDRHVRRQTRELRISDSVENKLKLADELMRRNDPASALALYRECLQGPFADNPDILLKFAGACFASNDLHAARRALEELFQRNPNFRTQDGRLLYARTLEALGHTNEALAEYAGVCRYYNGPEAAFRHGMLLKLSGRTGEAEAKFREILEIADLAPQHYRRLHGEWLRQAREQLA